MPKRTVVLINEARPPGLEPRRVTLIIGSSRHVLNLDTQRSESEAPASVIAFPPETFREQLAKSGPQSDECPDRNKRQGEQDHMQRFEIGPDNNIEALHPDAELPEGSAEFHSEQELAKVTSQWPATRLADVWNGLAGVTAVRKFKDRATAVNRIWKQVQSLTPPPPPKPSRKSAKKQGTTAVPPATKPATKKDIVIALLSSGNGATLKQVMKETGWQQHSVRGFLSGMLVKKMSLKVISSKNDQGERVYRIQQ